MRLPHDSTTLSESSRQGYAECSDAIETYLGHRILARTAFEDDAGHSILARFDTAYHAARFEIMDVLEPAYRFRPMNLPFTADHVTASQYYRTEQQIKELCMRLASYDCLDNKFGLAMVAEAELFTDSLIKYATLAANNIAPMDRNKLHARLPGLVNGIGIMGQRLRLMPVLWEKLSPDMALGHGVNGFCVTAANIILDLG